MWWRFYTELSVKMIDHALDYIAPSPVSCPVQSTQSLKDSFPRLERMLNEIASEMTGVSEMQRSQIRSDIALHARKLCMSEISHDLRTPLNAIIGFTQLMESGIFGPIGNAQYAEYLRHIRESGYEMLERIEDLLDIPAHPESANESKASEPHREFAI